MLQKFLSFRLEVVTRRNNSFYAKRKSGPNFNRSFYCVRFIDEVIAMIRQSQDAAQALCQLTSRQWHLEESLLVYLRAWQNNDNISHTYHLTDSQAKAILALRLQRLTQMEQGKLDQELKECHESILSLSALLASPTQMNALMKKEFLAIKEQFSTPRLTSIEKDLSGLTDEDLIECEDMVVTVSVKGYIKRVPLSTYRSQKRGGRGKSAMSTRDEDEVSQIFISDTHTPLLVFTSMGKAYQMKVYELPVGSANARGKPLVSLFPVTERIYCNFTLAQRQNMSIWFLPHPAVTCAKRISDF